MDHRTQSRDRETGLGSDGSNGVDGVDGADGADGADRADTAGGTQPASTDARSRRGTLTPRALLLFGVATLLGLAHHLDHVIRGNHVGWPITPDVNPFTYSLLIYPLVALGFTLSLTGRAGARYWTVVMTLGTAMLAFFHLSPWAVEPPSDVILPYADPAFGYLAFAILLALIGVVGAGALYSARQWVRESA